MTFLNLHLNRVQPGEGPGTPPLVLLAPFPMDARVWDGVLAELDGAAITVDPPGFGASPRPDGEPSLEVYARGLLEALDGLGIGRIALAGNSMGGYTAMAVVELAPERLAGLGLFGTKSVIDTDEARDVRLAMADRADAGAPARDLVGPMAEKLISPHTRATQPQLAAQLDEWLATAPTTGIAWAQRAMVNRPDRTEVLRALSVPAVVVHGEDDPMMNAAVHQQIAEALGTDVITLSGCGHLVPLEQPQASADALRRLLSQL